MSAAPIRSGQTREIHAIRNRTNLDDGSYRAMLQAYDVSSSKYLTEEQADRLLRRMRDIPGSSRPVEQSPKSKAADTAIARKLQAMWLSLYNLGEVEDRRDSAMHAFIEGRTKIPHTRFLRDWKDAEAAIEQMKAWLIRVGVVWPPKVQGQDREAALLAMQRAILRAQWLRCVALGAVTPFGPPEDCDGLQDYASRVLRGGSRRLGSIDDPALTRGDLIKVSRALGEKLRRAKAGKAEAPAGEVRHVG